MSELRPLGLNETKRLLSERGIVPSKGLGQNFVVDPNTLSRIARLAAFEPGQRVVEIGPGLGSLSAALLQVGARLSVVEIDARLVELLRERLPSDVAVLHADALTCDWDAVLAGTEPQESVVLVANLPYNIATTLVLDVLEREPRISRMLVMVQREVGERLAAVVGSGAYGQVTARVAYFATARLVGRVPPEVFFPRPKVESGLVSIERRAVPAVEPSEVGYEEIVQLLRAGFGTRRKMLRRSLAGLVSTAVFEAATIDSSRRAEDLSIEQWGKLAACRRLSENSPTPS